MSLKPILYTFLSKTFSLAGSISLSLSKLFDEIYARLHYVSYLFLEKRDLILFVKLLLEKSRGTIYSYSEEWVGLNSTVLQEFLENIGCRPIVFHEYDDTINYSEVYICKEINRIIFIHYEFKVTQHIWINWKSLKELEVSNLILDK
ncbi:MAG: hypothetical protein B6U89_03040 [Desulfurococcales archaeon ex4484_58]|nr:MAG: hypothetical protein B6U89_03040 [Desulfurococcales archaeon ex4484_58]